MQEGVFLSIAITGFTIAFAHAAIPTHWLPFVLAGRGQRWAMPKTLVVVLLAGLGHVLFTTLLGVLVVWLGIETSRWTGEVFPWIAGGALAIIGIYYLVRQARGVGHGHHHFGSGHDHHDHAGHDHAHHDHPHDGHDHHRHEDAHHGEAAHKHDAVELSAAAGQVLVDTGHGILRLDLGRDGGRARILVPSGDRSELPAASDVSLEIERSNGDRRTITFHAGDALLESVEQVPEQPWARATFVLGHGDHVHRHEIRLSGTESAPLSRLDVTGAPAKSDTTVILGLLALLTFSPCEGFLPVYLSGVAYGWVGFFVLSAILALATVVGMVAFTWLTLKGVERLRLGFLERYESGILGVLFIVLGTGIAIAGF